MTTIDKYTHTIYTTPVQIDIRNLPFNDWPQPLQDQARKLFSSALWTMRLNSIINQYGALMGREYVARKVSEYPIISIEDALG
jgi:hypothetical protein